MPTFQQVKLDQTPCRVEYFDRFKLFIVSTYQLYPTLESAREKFGSKFKTDASLKKYLAKINNRTGKLYLIKCDNEGENPTREGKIVCEHDCIDGGGVLDTLAFDYHDEPDHALILAAHTNGHLGIYWVKRSAEGEYTMEQKRLEKICKDSSTMVTSISYVRPGFVVAGDSSGTFSVISGETWRVLAHSHPRNCKSIGQVAILQYDEERYMIVVGAENCTWYVYQYEADIRHLTRLYTNRYKDFKAGITCIECTETDRFEDRFQRFEILIGSYDESIHAYLINIDSLGEYALRVEHRGKITIPGGGGIRHMKSVWFHHEINFRWNMMVAAAMNAGIYAIGCLESDEPLSLDDNIPVKIVVDAAKLKLPEKPQHYDVDWSPRDSVMCIADPINSLCLLAKLERHQANTNPSKKRKRRGQ